MAAAGNSPSVRFRVVRSDVPAGLIAVSEVKEVARGFGADSVCARHQECLVDCCCCKRSCRRMTSLDRSITPRSPNGVTKTTRLLWLLPISRPSWGHQCRERNVNTSRRRVDQRKFK